MIDGIAKYLDSCLSVAPRKPGTYSSIQDYQHTEAETKWSIFLDDTFQIDNICWHIWKSFCWDGPSMGNGSNVQPNWYMDDLCIQIQISSIIDWPSILYTTEGIMYVVMAVNIYVY